MGLFEFRGRLILLRHENLAVRRTLRSRIYGRVSKSFSRNERRSENDQTDSDGRY